MTDPVPSNVGHGHVFPRPDGVKARCGGPALCAECKQDLAAKNLQEQPPSKERDEAIAIANRWLDEPFADPDDDWRTVARQFLRAIERLSKPAHEREPPHCSSCSCGMTAPEPEALRREQVKAICHALSGTCVMVTDPHRPLCSVETCLAMEAAARAAQPPRNGQ